MHDNSLARRFRPRFTLIGAGVIGRHHASVADDLREELELVAVADTIKSRAEGLVTRYGGVAHDSLTSALAGTDTDVVVICTPTGTHGDLAIQALRAGKHVVIEKPADVTVKKVDEIIAARDESEALVSVISQHRFDPAMELILAKIAAGEFGRLVSGIASIDWYRSQGYYDSGDWRGTWALDGGGALMNQGVHTVDLLVTALGRPVEVVARTAVLAHERIEVEDLATALVTFESGAIGTLHATTAAYPGLSTRLQVHGDRGSAVIEDDTLTYIHTTPVGSEATAPAMGAGKAINQVDRYPGTGRPPVPAGSRSDGSSISEAHHYQYRNVLAALRGEEKIRVGLEENRTALAVIRGAYESARTGNPVSLKGDR